LAGSVNVQGEDVKKLDVVANEIFINCLKSSGKVSVMVSEENEEAIVVSDPELKGRYCVVFDPLDGSSNIDAGVSIGTIFGVYHINEGSSGTVADVLRSGRQMVAAGYAMYGSFTILVLSTPQGVNGYTLDPVPAIASFFLY
jgi:fructose-1,6-bisphosphatase I